jgi:hypothetical protein
VCPVDDGRRDERGEEADGEKDGAADACLVFGVAVRIQDLVEQRGEGVEEADVGAECEKDDVEGWGAEH